MFQEVATPNVADREALSIQADLRADLQAAEDEVVETVADAAEEDGQAFNAKDELPF